jgi:hypothetical protein
MTEKTITSSMAANEHSRTLSHANGSAPGHFCMNATCPSLGTHFPVILFGPANRIPGEALPYRLEVPKAVCLACQRHFQPEVYISDEARAKVQEHLARHGRPMPDYRRLFVTWKSLVDPTWAELKNGGEARFWF